MQETYDIMETEPNLAKNFNADMKIAIERMLETSDRIIDLCDRIAETVQDTDVFLKVNTNRSVWCKCRKNK